MKKSVRRVLIIVMAMMCCVLVTVPVSAAKKPSMKTVTRTYRKFLKKHIWNSSRYTSQGETTDTLVDINKDGVPELVVQYPNGNKYGVVVYTYKKGKVVRMTSKKGYIGISSVRQQKGKKYLVLQWTQSRQSTGYDVYQMKGTKLKRVYRYTYKYESLSEFNQGGYAYIPRKNGRYIGYNNYDKFERSLRDCIYQDYEDWMDFCY